MRAHRRVLRRADRRTIDAPCVLALSTPIATVRRAVILVRSLDSAAVDRRRLLATLAIVLGIILMIVAVVYWAEPAKSLPGFFPGHQAGSGHHHVKHGIAAFLVGLACFAFAWFNTGTART